MKTMKAFKTEKHINFCLLNEPVNDRFGRCLVWLVKIFGIFPFMIFLYLVGKRISWRIKRQFFYLKFHNLCLKFKVFFIDQGNDFFNSQKLNIPFLGKTTRN